MSSEWQAGKIYDRCAYLNCYNGKYSTGHKLFRFPAYDDSRHHLWIRYTGNSRLRTWASATIRRAGICADHFTPESFIDETHQSLRRHVVPKPYSSTNNLVKASPTLLTQIKSLPRKSTRSQKLVDSQRFHDDLEAENSSQNSDEDEPLSGSEKSDSIQGQINDDVKIRHNVKIVKIDKQSSKSNNIVILERCKNSKTCLAKVQGSHQAGVKPRSHFHKLYINRTKGLTEKLLTSGRQTNLTIRQISDGINDALRVQRLNKTLEVARDGTVSDASTKMLTEETEKLNDVTDIRMEQSLVNFTKTMVKKDETTGETVKCTNQEQKRAPDNNRNFQDEKSNPFKMKIPEYIRKKHPLTTELVDEYYRTKDERVLDRCAYMNCNKSRLTKGIRLFRFPKNTDPRLKTWIKNAGNARMLHWSWSTIRRAGLCSDHFETKSFFNETRQRLLRSAIPIPFHTDVNKSLDKNTNESSSQ